LRSAAVADPDERTGLKAGDEAVLADSLTCDDQDLERDRLVDWTSPIDLGHAPDVSVRSLVRNM
jgi:hypothetical protein